MGGRSSGVSLGKIGVVKERAGVSALIVTQVEVTVQARNERLRKGLLQSECGHRCVVISLSKELARRHRRITALYQRAIGDSGIRPDVFGILN